MTGFGAADGVVGGGRVSVEVRSVNHRFFSPSIKLPSTLNRWEGDVREALRRKVARGHVTLGARFERTRTSLQRSRARSAPGDRSHTGVLGASQFQGAHGKVTVAAQVHRIAVRVRDFHAKHIPEVPKALLRLWRQQLDAAQRGDITNRFWRGSHGETPVRQQAFEC